MTELKLVNWTDQEGYKHLSHVIDNEDIKEGIPNDPPDINQLDWEQIKQDLHNGLVDKNLITWHDIQMSGDGLTGVILTVLRKRIIQLYRMEEKDG